MVIQEKPKNRSERSITIKGKAMAAYRLLKKAPPNRAIAVTGVTFGTWGISLINTAIRIKLKTRRSFFLKFKTV